MRGIGGRCAWIVVMSGLLSASHAASALAQHLPLQPAALASVALQVPDAPQIDLDAARAAVRTEAGVRGLDPRLVDRLIGAIVPDESVAALAMAQPEHEHTVAEYVGLIVSDKRVADGLEKLQDVRPVLDRIARTYGVDPFVVLAIWGVESSYGNLAGERPILRSLLTLAASDERRAAFWRAELVTALELVSRGAMRPEEMIGSWAGAMGHTQFMPSTWARYGVDFDLDGRADPFGAPADALASTAAYLKASGWQAAEPWGFEVLLPPGFSYGLSAPGNVRSRESWQALGVALPQGRPWPKTHEPMQLVLPAGAHGPAFLTTPSFGAILKYNASMAYAMAVSLLSDRLAGRPSLATPWPTDDPSLSPDERREVQARLTGLGLATGSVDGVLGNLTRTAIRAYQKRHGLPEDGHPGISLLNQLRRETRP